MSYPPLQHLCAELVSVAQICESHHVAPGLGVLDHDDGGDHLKPEAGHLTSNYEAGDEGGEAATTTELTRRKEEKKNYPACNMIV